MADRVAELPAEVPGGEAEAQILKRRPNPAELPPFLDSSVSVAHELTRLRARVSSLEEQMLFAGRFRPGPGNPAELPEGGQEFGGGGGAFRRPPRINELPPFDQLASINQQLAALTERLAGVEKAVGSAPGP